MKIIYSTNCYYKDYKIVAEEYEYRLALNDYPFSEMWIVILNVDDEKAVGELFKNKADRVIIASKYIGETLSFFNLDINSFKDKGGKGLIYSTASLVELYLAKRFDYLCHYTSDVSLYRRNNWITPALGRMKNDIITARPGFPRYEVSSENEKEVQVTQDFSDHAYLLPIDKFRKRDFFSKQTQINQWKHPSYGGLSFERRISQYLHDTNQFQTVINSAEIIHPCYQL